jgi:hypothetical protein
MPDGFIYKRAIKASCDSNYKGGRYVIIDGVCQGGKKTEKPGCATCRTCQTGANDIAPVPDADLAVNECNSSCEKKEGGNPTPNPNLSTPTQTITPNPNSRGEPPNIRRPKDPPPAGITPRGGEGQPCKTNMEGPDIKYSCNEGLVCVDNKCVKPIGGEGQPCKTNMEGPDIKYSCNEGLVCVDNKCVKPTSPPGTTSEPGTTLEENKTPPDLPNKLNETRDGFSCSNNQNIRYCVKCTSINQSTNKCASFQYYKEGCMESIGNSQDKLKEYCYNTPTTVTINYTIEVDGNIPFGENNICSYQPTLFSPLMFDTYSYLKISILELKEGNEIEIFRRDEENIPNSFPIKGNTTAYTTAKSFKLVVAYYKDYTYNILHNFPNIFNPCQPLYESFTAIGKVRHEISGDVVYLTVTLIGEKMHRQ